MNKQDVFEQVDLLKIKPIERRWNGAVILTLLVAGLLVILATAVISPKTADSAVSALGSDSVYANPELNAFTRHAKRGETGTAVSFLHTNPELKVQSSYGIAASSTDARDFLAINPEVKVVGAYAAADVSTMRWQTMARYYEGADTFDSAKTAETATARWTAMAEAFTNQDALNNPEDAMVNRWIAKGQAYEKMGLLNNQ